MYTVNITTKVDHDIVVDWLLWQKEVHIPAMMATKCFHDFRFQQLIGQDDEDGKIFVLQFVTVSESDYHFFLEKFENNLKNQTLEKWGEKCFEFRSLLQNID